MSIDELTRLINKKNIPVVTLDEKWLNIFKDKEKTPDIKRLENNLFELLKLQGKVNTDIKELRKIKDKLTMDVLDAAQDVKLSENKRKKIQEKNQKLLRESISKMEELEGQQAIIPKKIKEANTALVIEGVKVCYERISRNAKEIDALDKWIEETRNLLKERVVQKQELETVNTMIYSYLHDMLGPQIMEAFDEKGN